MNSTTEFFAHVIKSLRLYSHEVIPIQLNTIPFEFIYPVRMVQQRSKEFEIFFKIRADIDFFTSSSSKLDLKEIVTDVCCICNQFVFPGRLRFCPIIFRHRPDRLRNIIMLRHGRTTPSTQVFPAWFSEFFSELSVENYRGFRLRSFSHVYSSPAQYRPVFPVHRGIRNTWR